MKRLLRSRAWYTFSRNPLSVPGLVMVLVIALVAIIAPLIAPYPEHVGIFVDFRNTEQPPSWLHLFGTDDNGRDIFSRTLYAYRASLGIGVLVLVLAVPVGVVLGLLAGYYSGLVETIIMRTTDVFLALPPLALAMAVMGALEPSLINIMMAIAIMWWPWHTRLIYSLTRSLRHEGFVEAAKVAGASDAHILFREILPNCVPSLLTKMTFDVSFVILMIAALGFVGLGMQPPTPDLGRMVAQGVKFMPFDWWMSVFPGLAILILVLALNLLGDGLRDMLDVDN
jgi:peptide/nickel transport system permease protein